MSDSGASLSANAAISSEARRMAERDNGLAPWSLWGSYLDVVIIGSGVGGGTLARALAPTGLKILVLERGDWLPQEPQNWDAEEVFQKNRYIPKDTWFDKHGKPFQPGSHYFLGGATRCTAPPISACASRISRSSFTTKHLAGLAPALKRFRALVSAGRGDVSRAWPAR